MSKENEIIGYHGTDQSRVKSIQENNFNASQKKNEWLGYGVYFFVNGISDPIKNAIEWGKNEAYNKGSYDYETYSVLKAAVSFDRLLDTTTIEGLSVFNTLRDKFIDKYNEKFHRSRDFNEDDRLMWNLVASHMKLDIVIHNLYIKNKVQRCKKIRSNVPNTTVMCVCAKKNDEQNKDKTLNIIDIKSIQEIRKGSV